MYVCWRWQTVFVCGLGCMEAEYRDVDKAEMQSKQVGLFLTFLYLSPSRNRHVLPCFCLLLIVRLADPVLSCSAGCSLVQIILTIVSRIHRLDYLRPALSSRHAAAQHSSIQLSLADAVYAWLLLGRLMS